MSDDFGDEVGVDFGDHLLISEVPLQFRDFFEDDFVVDLRVIL